MNLFSTHTFDDVKRYMSNLLIKEWIDILPANKLEVIYDIMTDIDKVEQTERVFPDKNLTFDAYNTITPSNVNCIIVSKCPYPNPNANGHAFACARNISPSLRQLLYSWTDNSMYVIDQKNNFEDEEIGLESLIDQGVLLLNYKLRVKNGDPNSFKSDRWFDFTRSILKEYSRRFPKTPILFLGSEAKDCSKDLFSEYIFYCDHPAAASRNKKLWHCTGFNDINNVLTINNKKSITWHSKHGFQELTKNN